LIGPSADNTRGKNVDLPTQILLKADIKCVNAKADNMAKKLCIVLTLGLAGEPSIEDLSRV